MKKFVLAFALIFAAQSFAYDPLGGTIKNRRTKDQFFLDCLQRGDNDNFNCTKVRAVLIKENGEEVLGNSVVLSGMSLEEIKKGVQKRKKKNMKEAYVAALFAGVGVGAVGGLAAGAFNNDLRNQKGKDRMVLLMAGGAVVDLVKSPFVLLGWAIHSGFSKRKMKKAVKHLVRNKKRGKSMKLFNKAFTSIKEEFIPNPNNSNY